MCRASVLEGENAELRARLAASEQTNERLRSRLQSTVAAFHRMLAQEKEKSEGKDSELAGIKTHSLQLQGFLLLMLPLVLVIYTQERNSESNFENVFTLSLSLSLARSLALSLSISLSLSSPIHCRETRGALSGGEKAETAGGSPAQVVLFFLGTHS